MRILIQFLSVLLSTLTIVPPTIAIFADEAYHIDYHHQLLGLPLPHTTFFHRPQKDDRASLLYTLSDQGVLGAVNPGTGTVVWRQFLASTINRTLGGANGLQSFLRAAEGDKTVISAVGGHVNAWDALTGRVTWSHEFEGETRDLEVMESVVGEGHKDVLVLIDQSKKGVLKRLDGATGNVVWEYLQDESDLPFQVSTNLKSVFIVSLLGARGGYNLKITTLDPNTGKKIDEHTLASKADVHAPEDILFVGANIASPIVAWTDQSKKALKVNILGTRQIHTLSLGGEVDRIVIHAPHLIQSRPHFLVHSQTYESHSAVVFHVDLVAGTITEAYRLPKLPGKGAFSTSSREADVYFTRHTEDELIITSSQSHGFLERFPLERTADIAPVLYGVSEVVPKSANAYAIRSAVVTTEDTWEMIRNGAPVWKREEGLTGAVAAAWAEIPEKENLAKTLEEEAHSSPLSAYIHRVKRHINDLQFLPKYLQKLPLQLLSSILPGDNANAEDAPLVRDNFGFRKLVIVATERSRIYALDTGNKGKVVWKRKGYTMPAGEKWDVKGIFVDKANGNTVIRSAEGGEVTVKTDSGLLVGIVPRGFQPPIQATAIVDSAVGRQWMMSIGENAEPVPFPPAGIPNSIVVVKGHHGEVKGLTFETKNDKAVSVDAWIFQPPSGQRLLSVVSRPAHDPVASIGRVLSDRSVMYKYLNPNTILVTTVSDAESTASFYLIDSVSGEVLYSTTHEAVDIGQPITALLTENWFVYSFWADHTSTGTSMPSSKGYQLVVSELFESSLPNDRGPRGASTKTSSLEPSEGPTEEATLPHVVSQAFIIPEAISNMAVTQTKQGIATRQLLCKLASSNAIVAIPRNLLDPRRIVGRDPTPAEMEEGLMRYNPFIGFDPKMIITHNIEVLGIRNIITSPSLLESTSLVFAYGIDIFGTRVTPSQAFDILGKDFNRVALVVTVTLLALGVGVLAPMVRKKQINGRWRTT